MSQFSSMLTAMSDYRPPQVDLSAIRQAAPYANSLADLGIVRTTDTADYKAHLEISQVIQLYFKVNSLKIEDLADEARKILFGQDYKDHQSTPMIVSPNVSAVDVDFVVANQNLFADDGFNDGNTIHLYAKALQQDAAESLEANGYVNFHGSWGDRRTTDVNEYVGWLYDAAGIEPVAADSSIYDWELSPEAVASIKRVVISKPASAEVAKQDTPEPNPDAAIEALPAPDAITQLTAAKQQVLASLANEPKFFTAVLSDSIRQGLQLARLLEASQQAETARLS